MRGPLKSHAFFVDRACKTFWRGKQWFERNDKYGVVTYSLYR